MRKSLSEWLADLRSPLRSREARILHAIYEPRVQLLELRNGLMALELETLRAQIARLEGIA